MWAVLLVSRPLVGGSTLQSIRKFSVTFLLTFFSFFKTNIKLSVQKNRLSRYLVKEMDFSWKLGWEKGEKDVAPSSSYFVWSAL